MKLNFSRVFVMIITTTLVASCKKDISCEWCITGKDNQPPIACAGPDQTITLPANSVLLDGSCSTDPENSITGYIWTKISGPASFNIANANGVQSQINNLVQGTYLFELKVTDAGGLFSTDTVKVVVTQQDNSVVDVYVAGDYDGVAAYWKNGQRVILNPSGNSAASSIAVAGADVYVAGWEGDAFMYGNNIALYWKNGQKVFLTGPTGAGANSITIADGNVYVAGWEFKGFKTVAKYWINSQPVSLTDGSTDAEASCIAIFNGDIYVSGHENGVAKYWKNGRAVALTDGSHQAYANSIAIAGNDVYVAGSELDGPTGHVAKYWKNGQPVSLTSGSAVYATATSIAIAGSDVYVAGWEGDFVGRAGGTGAVAKYWKNGQAVSLTNGTNYGYARSIALFGSDVYVAGVEIEGMGGSQSYSAKYWAIGNAVSISAGHGSWLNHILVVPR
jgi:hypothetical protein